MKKVIVIGCPGSGKSYFSKKLAKVTKLPLYHLDVIYHKVDVSEISREEFDNFLNDVFKKDEWILDGNYQRTLEMRLKECDPCFLLDISTYECLKVAYERAGTARDDLPFIENELDKEFEKRIIDFSNEKLPKIYELLNKYNDKNIIIFKSRQEAEEYIKTIE